MNNYINCITPIVKINSDIEGINLYIKRDDLLPFSFGGNKLRIAYEFFLDMFEKGCNCIICYGSSRSNLCRVVANIAKSLKIECHIISLVDDKKETTNSILVNIFGAFVHSCYKCDVSKTVENVVFLCKKKGLKPYYIYGDKYGKGNEATPVAAYAKVYSEIVKQAQNMGKINFDYIFCPSGTGMTQAGLIVGNHIENTNSKIVGISVARKKEEEVEKIKEYIFSYCQKNNIDKFIPEIIFEDKYLCGGYAEFSQDILNTVKEMISFSGIPFDTTYTGKAFYGMKKYIKENSIKNKNVLFIHTGGTPLFFDNVDLIKNNVVYSINNITYQDLLDFILMSDNEFTPALSSRVDLRDYAEKLYNNSILFEAYIDEKLVALIAMYANDFVNKKAYITYVYCKKEYRKLGITKQLIQNAFEMLKQLNFKYCDLEVSVDNLAAINLYNKFNFKIVNKLQVNSCKALMQSVFGGGGTP